MRNGAQVNKKIDGIIALDVNRSFKGVKSIAPEAVTRVLRAYALFDFNVEYCQGMNFVVGFLYLLTKDEGFAFATLVSLVRRMGMEKIYADGVPMLRCRFYQMDRILHLQLPRLAAYFRSEGISASLFSSGWIITLFTYSVEAVKEERPDELLLAIWDSFLARGWKAIFKAGVFLLRKLQAELLELRFEEVLHFVSDIPRSKLWNDPNSVREFRLAFKEIKITNSMLEALEEEYNTIVEEAAPPK